MLATFMGVHLDTISRMADAEQAYVQALLTGTETWVCLPPEARVGKAWKGWEDPSCKPVVRLRLALYGHPDSGTCWERHCDAHLKKVGFEPVSEIWNSCYYHKKLKLLLVVYVDDFKMAGPTGSLDSEGWKLIRQGLTMEEPEKLGVFLGCNHVREEVKLADGRTATQMRYEMESFMRSCVELYKELAPSSRLRTVDTPFLPEDQALSPHGKAV